MVNFDYLYETHTGFIHKDTSRKVGGLDEKGLLNLYGKKGYELIQIISHPEYIDKGKFGKTLAGEWVTYYFKKKVNKNEKI